MRITMLQTRSGGSLGILVAGTTYAVPDEFGAQMIGSGWATDTDRFLVPLPSSLTPAAAAAAQAIVGDQIAAPAFQPIPTVGTAGALTGTYGYVATYVTSLGETAPSPGTASTAGPVAQRINLTGIQTGPVGVIARRLYRTIGSAIDVKDYYFLVEISDNTTTTYADNIADVSLGAPVNWAARNKDYLSNGASVVAKFSDQSTSFGQGTFNTNAGYASSAFGFEALKANTSGRRNCAFGTYSLPTLTTGFESSCFGVHSGQSATTGIRNTFLGYATGFNVTIQNDNTFVGHSAGANAGLGGASANNTGVGRDAARGTVSGLGQFNAALGFFALRDINTADSVIGVGAYAGRYANASRQVFIDNQDRGTIAVEQDVGLIYGQATAGTTATVAGTQNLRLNAPTRVGWGSAVVANLPAASAALNGYRAWVSDATAAYSGANIGSTVAGAGANVVPVFCNGSAWVIG